MMKRWKLVVATALLVQTQLMVAKSPPSGQSLIAELSPLARAAQLKFPSFLPETQERISGRKVNRQRDMAPTAKSADKDWGLMNIGFFNVFGSRLLPLNSSTHPCSPEVLVAVVDTGIDYTHPDLKSSLWINPGESGPWTPPTILAAYTQCRDKSCNGIDDDHNGFIDDVAGWDFVNDVPLPFDTHGHGSHIAGIIASTATAHTGRPGVCPGVSILALKYYDNMGVGYNNLQNTVRAFHYAVQMGAQIINYSGGGTDPSPAERLSIEAAQKQGVLVVAAAGNEGQSNDTAPYFPASYGMENIVSVASINADNQLLPSSNWGARRVHVAAPGQSVVSCLPGGRVGPMTGTSQATAYVTGAAALLASQLPSLAEFDYRKIKHWLIEGARPLPANLKRNLLLGGALSLNRSLQLQQSEQKKAPAPIPVVALKPNRPSSPASTQ